MLSKAAIERRLRSKHPEIPHNPKTPVPGKYLLGRPVVRAGQLRSRILSHTPPLGAFALSPKITSPTGVLPGILFRPTLPAGDIANSVVTGDFNGDGNMDFVVANGGTDDLWIYLGKGDGTFQLPQIIPLTQGVTPVALAAADLRGNGTLDLVVAEFDSSTVGVLMGNGDGTFSYEKEFVLPQPPSAIVIDDFNHDGKLDIAAVMVTLSSNTLGVQYLATLLGDGTGNFGSPLITMNPGFYSTANTLASGDVNGDGFPDLLIAGPGLENSQIYLNQGDGTFVPGPLILGNGAFNLVLAGALADVNEDGCLDAVIADGNGLVWVRTGDCAGNFAPPTSVEMGDSNSSVAAIDVNGDGHLDLVTTTIPLVDPSLGEVAGNMIAVAVGDGHGNFSSGRDYVGTGLSYSAAIADFNHDGHADVVSVSPDTDTATVYTNDGSGGFGFPQGEWIGIPGVQNFNQPISSPSFADVNGDGKPDIEILDEGYNGEYFITSLLNSGTGRFSLPMASDLGIAITSNMIGDYRLGDFRNTGHMDFVAIGQAMNTTTGAQFILFAPGNGDGTFGKPNLVAATANGLLTVGDFNRDGRLDIAAVGSNTTGSGWILSIFLGNGDGTFRRGVTIPFLDTAQQIARVFAGDFNRDGKLDILIYDTGNGYFTTGSYVWEFLGNGDGTFQPGQQLFSAFQPMTMADINNDSWPDIVRYDFMWPDGTTQTFGTAHFTNYLAQPSGGFLQRSSLAPYSGIPLSVPPYQQIGDPTTSSMVADLNGDGNLDEIAFQYPPPSGGDIYAQILMGNGDGTFTPTYNILDFQKVNGFPAYAHILDGSAFSDLVEVDQATSSMHVFKGGPAPALQMLLEETQIIGNAGCGWVFLNLPSSSSTVVALSSSVPGVVLPASVNVPAGALSQRFCYTLSSNYDWRQVFDVRAQLGSDTAVAYASDSYVVGFSESISPNAPLAIYPGQSTSAVTIAVSSSQGYSSTVQLSCAALLAGETCRFGQSTLGVSPAQSASTTLIVDTTNSTQGTGSIVVTASDGVVTKRQALNVAVLPLSAFTLGSGLVQATSPGSGTAQVVINGIPPYNASCSGLPAGVTCAFSGNQAPYPNQTTLTLTVNVPASVAAATYPFNIAITSGPQSTVLPSSLVVEDFNLQPPSAASAWAPPGGSIDLLIPAQSINQFSSSINVSCAFDSGGTCTGGTVSISPNGTLIDLKITEPAGVAVGTQTLSVSGTYGPVTHSISFPFNVADYSGSLSATSLTMTRGGSATLSATVSVTAGFSGGVDFACVAPPQLSCNFSSPTVIPTPTSSKTTTITVIASNTAATTHSPKGSTSWAFALALPFVFSFKLRRATWRSSFRFLCIVLSLLLVSCGGGSSAGGGGGGSNSYTLTVSASAPGTNTTRSLGIVNVTVTH